MKKRELISWLLTGLLTTLISTFSPIIYDIVITEKAKNENAQKTIRNLSEYYNESISYQYDEQGNYVRVIETKSMEIKILKRRNKESEVEKIKYKSENDRFKHNIKNMEPG